jgi:DDE superfamily endonuclease
MDGALFLAYVQQFLCATLRPGDGVIADNLSNHKVAGVREAIEATGATIRYLPPYSPDLYPIENSSRNSRHSFAAPPCATSRRFATTSARSSTTSHRSGSTTTSDPAGMQATKTKML